MSTSSQHVVTELDKHKRHKNSKIAQRAKTILKKIDEDEGLVTCPLMYLRLRPKESTWPR